MKGFIYKLRQLHGFVHDQIVVFCNSLHIYLDCLLPIGRKVFIVGTPTHTNVGDSAIVFAETEFIKMVLGKTIAIKELTIFDIKKNEKAILNCLHVSKGSLIFWHGGGNMGDQWLGEEIFRRSIISKLPENKMIVFPQTFFYSRTEKGKEERDRSIPVYNKKDLTIVAREKVSFQEMNLVYTNSEILLAPDIVLSTNKEMFGMKTVERNGVLFCTREDTERIVDDTTWNVLREYCKRKGFETKKTDMHCHFQVTKTNRFDIIKEKMQEFCYAKLVITDRLHGMIFAAITETPCIVFSNNHHKVKGTYDWISYLNYIRFANNADEAKVFFTELIDKEECHFYNTPLIPFYERLVEVIRRKWQE